MFLSPSLIFKAVHSFPHYRGQTFCLFVYLLRVHLPIRENNGLFQFSIPWNFLSSRSESVVNEQQLVDNFYSEKHEFKVLTLVLVNFSRLTTGNILCLMTTDGRDFSC